MKPNRAAFSFVFITVCLDMLALGIMIPVLPQLIVQFRGGDIAKGAAMSGVFGCAWAAMQFLFSPVLGALSDRFGRRPVILLSNFGLGFDYILMAVAPSLPWLFAGRIISGITSSSYPTACAYISDVTPPQERAAKFGLLSAAFGLGFVVGPSLGGLLAGVNLRFPFWVAAGLSLANAVYGFFILPESHAPEKRSKSFLWKRVHPVASLRFLSSYPGLLGLTGIATLFYLAHESLPAVFVLYTDYRYHWQETTVGLVLGAVGISQTIVSAAIVGPAVKKFGERRALLGGLLFGVAGFAIYGLSPTGMFFAAGVPVMAMWGLIGPSMQSIATGKVSGAEQGQLQGALSSVRGIMGMLGPLIFTQIFAAGIAEGSAVRIPGAPYLLAAALLGIAFVVAWTAAAVPARSKATLASP